MTNQPNLILNPYEIVFSFTRVAKETYESVALCLQSLESNSSDKFPMIPTDNFMLRFNFDESSFDLNVLKPNTKCWLLKRGFEKLITGINESLIAAVSIKRISEDNGKAFKNRDEMIEYLQNSKKVVQRLKLHTLIKEIEEFIDSEIDYKKEIYSLNEMRRWLVHRNERSSPEGQKGEYEVKWISSTLILNKNGEPTVVTEGFINDEEQPLKLSLKQKSKTFVDNQPVDITSDEFLEIVGTCIFFVKSLATKVHIKLTKNESSLQHDDTCAT